MPRSCLPPLFSLADAATRAAAFGLTAMCGAFAACGAVAPVPMPTAPAAPVATFDRMPAGVAVLGESVYLSFPRWVESGDATVYRWDDGVLTPYPPVDAQRLSGGASALHSVNGITIDRHGRLWMLDNGRVDLGPAASGVPKLVVWDLATDTEAFRVLLPESVAPAATSFANDLAVDVDRGVVYITDTGLGGEPALLVVDLLRDRVARVLAGHDSVAADPHDAMTVDGAVVMAPRGDAPWRVAANAIALSDDGETLYFGAMTARTLFAVPTAALRREAFGDEAYRASADVVAVQRKPITDGIARCADDTLVLTDVEAGAILLGQIGADATTSLSDGLAFPVAVACTADAIWATSNELHRMPLLHGGDDHRVGAFHLWRFAR